MTILSKSFRLGVMRPPGDRSVAVALAAIALSLVLCGTVLAHGGQDGAAPAGADKPGRAPLTLADYDIGKLKLGGDFTLTNQDGKSTSLKRYRGDVVMLFFGYTFCPDVCPTTMTKVTRVRTALGTQGRKFQPIFVSIDPERDTPARLKAYASNFGGGIVALTGSAGDIAHAAGLYRARFDRESLQDAKDTLNYLMAHTAYLYLLDTRGKLRYVFPPDVDDALLIQGARRLLDRKPARR